MASMGGTNARGFGQAGNVFSVLNPLAKTAGKAAGTYVKNRSTEFDTAANTAFASAGDYSDEDWNMRYDQVNAMKKDYILGNRKERADIMREFGKLTNEQKQGDDTRVQIGEGALGPDGFTDEFKASDMGLDFQGIMAGTIPVSYDPITGAPGYEFTTNNSMDNFEIAKDYFLTTHDFDLDFFSDNEIDLYDKENESGQKYRESIINWYKLNNADEEQANLTAEENYVMNRNKKGEVVSYSKLPNKKPTTEKNASGTALDQMFSTEKKWHSIEETRRLLKENTVDVNAKKFIMNSANNMRIKSSKVLPGTNGAFPYEVVKADIVDNLLGMDGVNLSSLARDPMFSGSNRTWKTDMIEALTKSNYSELGIPLTEEEAKLMDETPRTPITRMDARIIVQNIMQDEDMYADYLAEYFTKFHEQNWNKGALARQGGDTGNDVNPNSFM